VFAIPLLVDVAPSSEAAINVSSLVMLCSIDVVDLVGNCCCRLLLFVVVVTEEGDDECDKVYPSCSSVAEVVVMNCCDWC
jgi:Ni2+-binding GTPase involved in maturation of urease and hydrogenase